jgi:F-type H+-transporting ATPase subunit epsilon
MSEMKVIIITGEKEVYSDDVDVIVAPGIEGDLGILPHHAALITSLRRGQIMIRKNGERTFLVVTGGFMEIINNKVTILADAVE